MIINGVGVGLAGHYAKAIAELFALLVMDVGGQTELGLLHSKSARYVRPNGKAMKQESLCTN
jgi:hypothetical protein